MTASGREIDFASPDPREINLHDIAIGLSREVRFAGHSDPNRGPYRVATHSVLVASLLARQFGRPDLVAQGLLHDATEAYMKDVPSPLKRLIPGYRDIEARLMSTILRKYGQPDELNPVVHEADWMAYCMEREVLMPFHSQEVDRAAGREKVLPAGSDWFDMVITHDEHAAREMWLTACASINAGWASK